VSLRIVRSCTAAETAELARYLAGTDVSGYGSLLRAGDAIASLVELVGRAELGRTWSIFGNLGGIEAPTAAGRLKFLVAEVRAILNRPDCTDVRSRDRLESIIAAERARELHDRRITLARTTTGAHRRRREQARRRAPRTRARGRRRAGVPDRIEPQQTAAGCSIARGRPAAESPPSLEPYWRMESSPLARRR
jgi:hypothetical protein